MVRASERDWESPSSLYIVRRIEECAQGRRLKVLDLGCGDGTTMSHVAAFGHDLFGYDLGRLDPEIDRARRRLLTPVFGESYGDRLKITDSERDIPFAAASFDVVYANQVFEHIRFLDRMFAECARVLRRGGVLLINFPLVTHPIEAHLRVPFVHWIHPGATRRRYMSLMCRCGVLRRWPGEESASPREVAATRDRFLSEKTFYRLPNEITSLAEHYFQSCRLETDRFLEAKLDLLSDSGGRTSRVVGGVLRHLDRRGVVSAGVTHFSNAAFCASDPHA